MSFVGNHCAGE